MIGVSESLKRAVEHYFVTPAKTIYFYVKLALISLRQTESKVSSVHILLGVFVHLDEQRYSMEGNCHRVIFFHIDTYDVTSPGNTATHVVPLELTLRLPRIIVPRGHPAIPLIVGPVDVRDQGSLFVHVVLDEHEHPDGEARD